MGFFPLRAALISGRYRVSNFACDTQKRRSKTFLCLKGNESLDEAAFPILPFLCLILFARSFLCTWRDCRRYSGQEEKKRYAEENNQHCISRSSGDRDEAFLSAANNGACRKGGRTLDRDTRTVPLLPLDAYSLLSRVVRAES